jgi:hypothetical protein
VTVNGGPILEKDGRRTPWRPAEKSMKDVGVPESVNRDPTSETSNGKYPVVVNEVGVGSTSI